MGSNSNEQSSQGGSISQQKILSNVVSLVQLDGSPKKTEEDDDEDEDVDFNPFLKETLSPEASSSLSSEVEVLDVRSSSEVVDEVKSCAPENAELVDGNLVQNLLPPTQGRDKELQNPVPEGAERDSESLSRATNGNFLVKGYEQKGADFDEDSVDGAGKKVSLVMDSDEEDAICKRTRARYSLASFTLDELESFLQETDDDDDLQNVDDEEEYRKFLAAVLQGGDGDGPLHKENENVDDEDEDNDADFEIELEEALDSDLDDRPKEKTHKEHSKRSGRRPETRQNRRLKASSENKKFIQQGKRPLRPLLPLPPLGPNAPLSTPNTRCLMADNTGSYSSTRADSSFINGFTLHQIGQLYSLLHEHVQLLIQIYSLCVLDTCKQQIASQVQELICEILHRRDQVLSWRNVPYPGEIFRPPYIFSSISDGSLRFYQDQLIAESSYGNNAKAVTSSPDGVPPTENVRSSKGQQEHVPMGPLVSSQTIEGFLWVPNISVPVLSILDVAPLKLVKSYMDDMSIAIREYRRRHVESSCDMRSERVPLFPLPSSSTTAEVNHDITKAATSTDSQKALSSSTQPLKKSLAAALVETTKKQSVALVPKEVAKLAQIFLPLFNRALFPHKPPPVAVTNRVLFTDAEDELLALGMMEYNTDWKAIQQRFLPCKSKHQIFVRQKNRCSSKAPENPIKAVRRMKTSPLTEEELRYIHEGLRIYKLDWMSVWKFIVPHRDPSLLPRQWRTATGTQKSYKQDAAKKEKRRIYEAERRRRKAVDLPSCHLGSEKEDNQVEDVRGESSGDDCIDDPEEAYVHEAFLADWRPGMSYNTSSRASLPGMMLSNEAAHDREQLNSDLTMEARCSAANFHHLPLPNGSQYFHYSYGASTMVPVHPTFNTNLCAPKGQFTLRPHRTRRTNSARLVKLAPNLPPVNLPRNVRVLSQSTYRSNQDGASSDLAATGVMSNNARRENASTTATQSRTSQNDDDAPGVLPEGSRAVQERTFAEERCNRSELQMHPLLFQVPTDGRLPYYPSNCSTSSSAFSFFSGSQPQLNLSLFRSPHHAKNDASILKRSLKSKDATSRCFGIDFHPLLQRIDDADSNLQTAGHFNASDSVQNKSPVSVGIPLDPTSFPSSSLDRANELDLEINLSSSSRKTKDAICRDKNLCKAMGPGALPETQESSRVIGHHLEGFASGSGQLISGSHSIVTLSDRVGRSDLDVVDNQSNPGIVMEQEELSDSDEELDEHVEFECEEMADSEGEYGEGMGQVEASSKDVPRFAPENVAIEAQKDAYPLHEEDNCCNPGPCISTFGKASEIPLNLWLESYKNSCNNKSRKSWLSLDSSAQSSGSQDPKSASVSRPGRACKRKADTKSDGLGSVTAPAIRRPRKRANKRYASPSIGAAVDTGSSGSKDNM